MTLLARTSGRRVPITLLLLLLGAAGVAGQSDRARELKPLPIEAVLSARAFGEYAPMRFSPDGRWLTYPIRKTIGGQQRSDVTGDVSERYRRTGVPWYAAGTSLWVVNTQTGKTRDLTADQGNNWAPSWSADGQHLAFLSDRAAAGQAHVARLWVWELTSDTSRLVADVSVRSREVIWSNDGRRLLVGVLPEGVSPEEYAARAVAPSTAEEPKEAGSTVRVYRSAKRADPSAATAGGWTLDRAPVDLAWVHLADGRVDRIVRNTPISKTAVSPDGTRIAYTTAKRFEKAGSQQILYDLVALTGGESRIAATDIRLNYDGGPFAWSPDSQRLAYRTAGMLANGDVYVAALDGAPPRLVTPAPHPTFVHYSEDPPLWDATGQSLYFADDESLWHASAGNGTAREVAKLSGQKLKILGHRERLLWETVSGTSTIVLTRDKYNGQCGFQRIGLKDGVVSKVQVEDKFYGGYGPDDGIAVLGNGRALVYAAQDAQHGPDLYLFALGQGSATRLTTINPDLEGYVMGERQVIEWRTIDGTSIRGVLVMPAGYQRGQRYPLITKVYGGFNPTEHLANRFGLQSAAVDNLQLYTTRGYAVLLPDVPLNEGTVMIDLLKAVMPGVDKVIEMGIADAGRLGLTGHSFGGYNTIALLAQTRRFKAAMMSAGMANLVSAYNQMRPDGSTYGIAVMEQGQFLLHGTPWEQRGRYLENSPVLYLDRVQTPLLIVHGGADSAVAPFLADEIFVGLRRLGKDVVYAKYEGEEHHQQTWNYANQLDYWTRVLAWFDHWLKGPLGTVR